MKKRSRIIAVLFTLISLCSTSALHAKALCTDGDCNIVIQFDIGGSLTADNGALLRFGAAGNTNLGDGGSINPGEGGSLHGISIESLVNGNLLPANQLIELGINGSIEFGPGGLLALGLGGNVEYPESSSILIKDASAVKIDSTNDATVTLAGIEVGGTVSLIGENIALPSVDHAPGLYIYGGTVNDSVHVSTPAIVVYNIVSAGLINVVAPDGSTPENCITTGSNSGNLELTNGGLSANYLCSGSLEASVDGQIDPGTITIEIPAPNLQLNPGEIVSNTPDKSTPVTIDDPMADSNISQSDGSVQISETAEQGPDNADPDQADNPFTQADSSGGGSPAPILILNLLILIFLRHFYRNRHTAA